MKKLTALLAAMLLAFAAVGCSGDDEATEAPADSPAASAEA